MAKDVTPISNFSFDNDAEDWSFGTTKEDKTNTSTVVNNAKAGTTIDEEEDDDENETPVNLDKEAGKDKDDDEKPEIVEKKKVAPVKKVEAKKEEKKVEKKEEEDKDEEDDDIEFFEDKKKENKSKESKVTKEEEVVEEDDEEFFTSLATEMKEKGILEHVEIPKDKKLTEDDFLELHDEEIEARVAENLEAFVEDMPEDAKALIKHLKRKGSVASFVQAYAGSGIDYDKFDVKDEAQRNALIRYYVTNHENLDSQEDIDERIQGIIDGGKAEAKAEQWATKLKKLEDKEKEDFEEAEKTRIEGRRDANKKFNEALINTISKVDEVNGFPISSERKKKLGTLFTKPTVKVGKDKYIPEFQNKLAQILNPKNEESRKKLVLLGELIDSDFDFSNLTPKVETKVVKRAQSIIRKSKEGSVKASTAGGYANRVLADAFADDED